MKKSAWKRVLILGIAAAGMHVAQATITVDAYFRLGENDSGATVGQPGRNPTLDANGTVSLTNSPVSPTNTAAGSSASRCTGSTLAMQFNGSSYYITNSPIAPQTNNFGLEAWFKPDFVGIGSQIVTMNGYHLQQAGHGIWIQNGNLQVCQYGISSILYANVIVSSGIWYHVAYVVTSKVGCIYVNGTLMNSMLITNNLNAPKDYFTIGSEGAGMHTFKGEVDEVRVFHFNEGEFNVNDLLYVNPSATLSRYSKKILNDNPLAYYPMSETEGPFCHDAATNAAPSPQQGTQNGYFYYGPPPPGLGILSYAATTPVPGPAPDTFRGFPAGHTSVFFDGTGDYNANFTSNILFTMPAMSDNYSMECWIYNTRTYNSRNLQYFLGRGAGSGYDVLAMGGGYGGFGNSSGKVLVWNGASASAVVGSTVLAYSNWYHVVMTRTGSTVSVYLNGILEGSGTLSKTYATNAFRAGTRPDNGWSFQGGIDEIAIYDRVLTDQEVLNHFNAAIAKPQGSLILIK